MARQRRARFRRGIGVRGLAYVTQRTAYAVGTAAQYMRVDFRGLHIAVAKLLLYRADIRAGLEQMGGERMPQGMAGDRLLDARSARRHAHQLIQAGLVEVVAAQELRARLQAEP